MTLLTIIVFIIYDLVKQINHQRENTSVSFKQFFAIDRIPESSVMQIPSSVSRESILLTFFLEVALQHETTLYSDLHHETNVSLLSVSSTYPLEQEDG